MMNFRNGRFVALLLAGVMLFSCAGSTAAAETQPETTTAQTTEAHRHTYGIWEVQRKATNKKNGLLVRVCSGCGKKQTKRIARIRSAAVKNIEVTYTGKAIKNKITVKNKDGRTLKENRDYTVAYKNNDKAGKAILLLHADDIDELIEALEKNDIVIVPADEVYNL